MRASKYLAYAVAAVFTFASCGFSPRYTYVADRYFEHCQRADSERSHEDSDLADCWEAWLEHYSDGQRKDRIRHARERRLVLAGGDAMRVTLPTSKAISPEPRCRNRCDTLEKACRQACAVPDCNRACDADYGFCTRSCI